MDATSITWSAESPFETHLLLPAPVFPTETLHNLEGPSEHDDLTYTTLESVKLAPLELGVVCLVSSPHSSRRSERAEQPVDLTLARHINLDDVSHFKPPDDDMKVLSIPEHSAPLVTKARDSRALTNSQPPHPPSELQATCSQTSSSQAKHHTQQHPTAEAENEPVNLKSLVCDYIDHLIAENEQITQISRAYTVPTPLDFENEHYFEEVRNTDHHFPSPRFRLWLEMREYGDYHDKGKYSQNCEGEQYGCAESQRTIKRECQQSANNE